jgi:membrane protein implicated in regulation of membrane protease activity
MWPLTHLHTSPDVAWQLTAFLAVSVVFVFAVFAMLLRRLTRTRREIRTVTCPVAHRRALVIVQRSADGAAYDVAVHCSQWHDGKLDCGQQCVEKAA